MFFGAHVSIAGGIPNAPKRAKDLGCEVFQIFSRSPRGGKPSPITKKVVCEFQKECKNHNQRASYIHTPYFINFASSNKKIFKSSIEIVREDLERASKIGVKAIMTHLGSSKDTSPDEAIDQTAQGVASVLKGHKGKANLLLELSAGAGLIIGSTFEDMALIIKKAEAILNKKNIIGVCLDTAHIFASGYDIRDKKTVDFTIKAFDAFIGIKRLGLIHANDSKVEIGTKKDRHEHLGKGKIGKAGFEALVRHPKLKNIDIIVETPTDSGIKRDIAFLKKARG